MQACLLKAQVRTVSFMSRGKDSMNRSLMALPGRVGTVAMMACFLLASMVGQAHAISLKEVEATFRRF